MTTYTHLSSIEALVMAVLSVLSNCAGLPLIAVMFQNPRTRFQGIVMSMSFVTSLLYHLCEVYDCTLFLNQLQWHRLDNVFAITSFELVILYAVGAISPHDDGLKWAAFLTAIVIQEKDPWNVTYTVAPCLFFLVVGLAVRWHSRDRRRVVYDVERISKAALPLGVGLIFFYVGLENQGDYLRIFHCCWHVCAGFFAFYSVTAVTVTFNDRKEHGQEATTLLY